jgi:hypothetical protein
MYVFNDIRLVINLGKYKLLNLIMSRGDVAIASMRLQKCDFQRRLQVKALCDVLNLDIDDCDLFDQWRADQNSMAPMHGLATIYVAKVHGNSIIVLSPKDLELPDVCKDNNITSITIDELMQEVADKDALKLYNLVQNYKME